MDTKEIEKNLIDYINTHGGISSSLGELKFTNSDRIGQGGNGLVYLATINEKGIAIKFLISDSKRKVDRFKSEYFNTNYVRDELCNIVNMIHYEKNRNTRRHCNSLHNNVSIFKKFKKAQNRKE